MPYNDEYLNDAAGLSAAIEGQEAVVVMVRAGCPHCENTKAFLEEMAAGDVPIYLLSYDAEREAFLEGRGMGDDFSVNGEPALYTAGHPVLPVTVSVAADGQLTSVSLGPIDNPARLVTYENHSGQNIADAPSLSQAALLGSTLAPYGSGDVEPSHPTDVRLAEAPSTDVYRG